MLRRFERLEERVVFSAVSPIDSPLDLRHAPDDTHTLFNPELLNPELLSPQLWNPERIFGPTSPDITVRFVPGMLYGTDHGRAVYWSSVSNALHSPFLGDYVDLVLSRPSQGDRPG